jgi:hypothetical protein
MIIDKETATAPSSSPTLAPPDGSKKCPYCPPDRGASAGAFFASDELGLLRYFVGAWDADRGSKS